MRAVMKLAIRTIRAFKGRYIAILLIVLLSSGFFSGLKICRKVMYYTGQTYLESLNFYDYKLLSTLGYAKESVDILQDLQYVEYAEGTFSKDMLLKYGNTTDAYTVLSLPDTVNLPSLKSGRMPQNADECLADARIFTGEDIGSTVQIDASSDEDIDILRDGRELNEWTIVGLADSPCYLGNERGTTELGTGSIKGFLYVLPEVFDLDVYTQVDLCVQNEFEIYSDEYEGWIDLHMDSLEETAESLARERYEQVKEETGFSDVLSSVALNIMGVEEPETYILTRNENAGYVKFRNDTAIVSGIADILPVFFIAIAMLVCVTTMTRMVEEERTQIGTLKSLGYTDLQITMKYLIYAGSAALFGWFIGFPAGTYSLPKIFWWAYSALYDFAPLPFMLDYSLALITLAVSMLSILLSVWFSCKKELLSVPAVIMRPQVTAAGKRILLERISFVWNRFGFLQKVTIRNMFRYKHRLLMMIVGIACCCGLVVTGFGVRDSLIDIADIQYGEIQTYDFEVSIENGQWETVSSELLKLGGVQDITPVNIRQVTLEGSERVNHVTMVSFIEDKAGEYWNLTRNGDAVALPSDEGSIAEGGEDQPGEAVLARKTASMLGVSVGDSFIIENDDLDRYPMVVSGIYDNYIGDYLFVGSDTAGKIGGSSPNSAFVKIDRVTDDPAGQREETLEQSLGNLEMIRGITKISDLRDTVNDSLACVNYIIVLVILFAGALAFIVMYNLTNINLSQRSREVATVKVLGFSPRETQQYILWENIAMSVLAALVGLPLGKLFHHMVMERVQVDQMWFQNPVHPISFLYGFVCTVLFAVLVNRAMKNNIDKIQMAESLKAIE